MVILLVILFLIIVLIDLRGLLETENRIKTMIIYFSLLTTGFTISFLQVIDRAPTSPAVIIEKIVKFVVPGG